MTTIPADIIEAAKASLGDVLPSVAHADARYHCLGHAVSFSQDGLNFAGGADQPHSGLIELAGRVQRAARRGSAPSSLGVHLPVVFRDSSPSQMPGIHAGRIVAGVEDAGAGRSLAPDEFKGNVCPEAHLTPAMANNAVALLVRRRSPRPAFIRASAVNFRPKSFLQTHGENLRQIGV